MNYYVYMMKAGKFVKIGVAKNPEKRKEQMQTGNPFPIEIIALLSFGSQKQAYSEEGRLHKALKKHHFRGEWFMEKAIKDALRHDLNIENTKKRKGRGATGKRAPWSVEEKGEDLPKINKERV